MPINDYFINGLFAESLLQSGTRIQNSTNPIKIRLDRNESSFDVNPEVKSDVIQDLSDSKWQKYPPPYDNDIEELIASYNNVRKEQIVAGAGSANIITSLLNYFAINNKQIVIAQPSFSLYEYHCKSYGIKYDTWKLNSELEYDIKLLPKLQEFSLVLFASPNNPVGNRISTCDLIELLRTYPNTVFLSDGVYREFSDQNHAVLLDDYPNLVLLRSFSKTFSSAGLRIGYLIADEKLATNFRKLILPFVLNLLASKFVTHLLNNPAALEENKINIATTIKERNRVYDILSNLDPTSEKLVIKSSDANFLLIIFKDEIAYKAVSAKLEKARIQLLDLSNIPALGNSLRFTIGLPEENDKVIAIFKSCI